MAGIKRKDAPKAVSAQAAASKKKQKLATSSTNKKSKPVAKVVEESPESEDDDEDMLDGQGIPQEEDSGSGSENDESGADAGGVALNGNKRSHQTDSDEAEGEKKIKSMSTTRHDQGQKLTKMQLDKHQQNRMPPSECWPKSARQPNQTPTRSLAQRRSGSVYGGSLMCLPRSARLSSVSSLGSSTAGCATLSSSMTVCASSSAPSNTPTSSSGRKSLPNCELTLGRLLRVSTGSSWLQRWSSKGELS